MAAIMSPVMGATYTVGVELGSTSEYDLSQTASIINGSQHVVYGIVGTEVTFNVTQYVGTMPSNSLLFRNDVANESAWTFGFLYAIAAGLQAGDPIYPLSPMTINETITATYGGVSRQINHISIANGMYEGWYDQETGLMVKLNFWFFSWSNFTMTSTDAWEPVNLFSTTNLLLIGVGVEFVVIVALAMRGSRSGKKKKK